MIGKIQFRFLDPALARKYDSDGMATALFTTVGCVDNFSEGKVTDSASTDSSQQWPLTIIVSSDVIERLRKILLTIMNFECTDAYERKEILPKIVASASFFGEATPRNADNNACRRDHDIKDPTTDENEKTKTNTTVTGWFGIVENAIELRKANDVWKILEGLRPGDDLKIWIETSPPGILRKSGSRPSAHPRRCAPSVGDENQEPNKGKGQCRMMPLPSSPKRPMSSSLKAITQAGNIIGSSKNSSAFTKPTTMKRRECPSPHAINDRQDIRSPTISSAPKEKDTSGIVTVLDTDSAIPFGEIPIPGYPVFSDFCCNQDTFQCRGSSGNGCVAPAMDGAIATSSALTACTSTKSGTVTPDAILQDGDRQNRNNQDDDHDSETLLLLALAGCAPKGGYDAVNGFFCSDHEDDGLLSGLLISDEEYSSDEDNLALINHVDQGENAASSMLTYSSSYSTIGNNPCCTDTGNSNHNDSGTNKNSIIDTKSVPETYLMPSFFETKTSLCSVSSSSRFGVSDASTVGYAYSSYNDSKNVDVINCLGKDALFLESTSLLQGTELEMANLVESVLECIFGPDDSEQIAIGNGGDRTTCVDVAHTNPTESHLHPESLPFPCPTPQELLTMDWNH